MAPPYYDEGHFRDAWMVYEFAANANYNYQLWIEYAALTSRPCNLRWNGALIESGRIGNVTGGWEEIYQKWDWVADVQSHPGINTLEIHRSDTPIPHIRSLELRFF